MLSTCVQDDSPGVRSIATKFNSPSKPEPEEAVSPHTGDGSEGRRSRFAKRALGVFRMSRSVSADGHPGESCTGDVGSWSQLHRGKLHASIERREQMGECERYVNGVPLLNRRLSMGDSRVNDTGRMNWDDLVRSPSCLWIVSPVPKYPIAANTVLTHAPKLLISHSVAQMLHGPDHEDSLTDTKGAQGVKDVNRPSFLERTAIRSVDLKPW
jgi:hypothetical protein